VETDPSPPSILEMKKIITSILFFTIGIVSWSQGNYTKIVVIDRVTNEVIPYTAVIILPKGSGVYSNEIGECVLYPTDSILVRHVSYHPFTISFKDLKDTIFLDQKREILEVMVFNNSKAKKESRLGQKFKYDTRLIFNLPSFEIGKIIELTNQNTKYVYIPIKKPQGEVRVALKLFSVKNNAPDKLLLVETQKISSDYSLNYLSFNSDISKYLQNKFIFVSIELTSNSSETESIRSPMKLHLETKNRSILTFATRNFDINQMWAEFLDQKQNPWNLVILTE
jgi:hypothetical protein